MNEVNRAKLDVMTLWELAVERAGRSPNAALAISEGGSEVTFSELRERAANAAEWFGRNGVNEGQNVGSSLDRVGRSPDF